MLNKIRKNIEYKVSKIFDDLFANEAKIKGKLKPKEAPIRISIGQWAPTNTLVKAISEKAKINSTKWFFLIMAETTKQDKNKKRLNACPEGTDWEVKEAQQQKIPLLVGLLLVLEYPVKFLIPLRARFQSE